MEGWSVIDLKNMSTMEMKQLMSQLQNEIQFREEIGESFNKQDPQLLVEDDSVCGI
jgi:hypothetical protein|tara:strand:+ start:4021 stop:4188 length:168 start_codon:yes stop_codon:yes gene_type:complete